MGHTENILFEDKVHKEWIDYNGHMNDAAYARVFSLSVDRLLRKIGINADFRSEHQYSIYTLETHICYLQEVLEGKDLRVTMQLLDYDEKRMHVFFVMKNRDGIPLATSEYMLMGMNMKERRPAPFPATIIAEIKALAKADALKPRPKQSGRIIGIRR